MQISDTPVFLDAVTEAGADDEKVIHRGTGSGQRRYPAGQETRAGLRLWRRALPFVPRSILESAVFLYQSEEDAHSGTRWGGSGFLVVMWIGGRGEPVDPVFCHRFAVTNDHIVTGAQAPVLRIIRADKKVQIVDGSDKWESHPHGDDVAVRYLAIVAGRDYNFFHWGQFLYPYQLTVNGIGPGDNCLMVGRFGQPWTNRQLDRPVLRVGNLAMLPEKIRQRGRGFDQESYLVDMRSISGFIGSAVLV